MTHNQLSHYHYTINEWQSENHKKIISIIFKNDDIKIIFDIGANTGATSSIFLNHDYKNIIQNIYCFEPDNENMNFLKKNNKNSKLIFIQKGVYYGKKEARVFGAGHVSENKIHPNVGGYGIEECMKQICDVRNKNGENVFCDHVNNKIFQLDELENLVDISVIPDFIKIDIEGAEKNVLMNSSIIKKAKYIWVEWNQEEKLDDFLEKHLPEFEIYMSGADFLLKNKNYNNNIII